MAQAKFDIHNLTTTRRLRGENQCQFWQRFGITQSGGSRYEAGRGLPTPTALLLHFYASGKINDDDLQAALAAVSKTKKAVRGKASKTE